MNAELKVCVVVEDGDEGDAPLADLNRARFVLLKKNSIRLALSDTCTRGDPRALAPGTAPHIPQEIHRLASAGCAKGSTALGSAGWLSFAVKLSARLVPRTSIGPLDQML